MEKKDLVQICEKYCAKLRISPFWDVKLQFVEDASWRKTGDIKIDCDDRKAVLLLNINNPKQEMYPLDQVTESLITSCFEEETTAQKFAYQQFFTALEQTVEELTKCFLLEFGENRELSFGRCSLQKSFHELYDGLSNLE